MEASRPHLILLEVMLPVFDGFYWVRRFRAVTVAPILVISIRGHPLEQVRGLGLGADDYVLKLFLLALLLAKIEAFLRRTYSDVARAPEELVSYAGLTVDRARGWVLFRDRTVLLTLVEQRLLLPLVQARGRAPAALACSLERRNVRGGECAVRERSQAPAEAPVLGFPGGIEAVRGLRCRLVMEEERSRVAEEYEGE